MSKYKQLIQKLRRYREARGWDENPEADIAKSISIEAAELLELFQWLETEDKSSSKITENKKQEIKDEIGDIIIYLTAMCDKIDTDLLECTEEKLKKVKEKYPADKIKGDDSEDFYYQQKEKYRSD
jgi:NTP pyrophosphatase (non-canonical NTP hydrolase)